MIGTPQNGDPKANICSILSIFRDFWNLMIFGTKQYTPTVYMLKQKQFCNPQNISNKRSFGNLAFSLSFNIGITSKI